VKLIGLKEEVDVVCHSLNDNQYSCICTPQHPGRYFKIYESLCLSRDHLQQTRTTEEKMSMRTMSLLHKQTRQKKDKLDALKH
jgi:hypothetical protein